MRELKSPIGSFKKYLIKNWLLPWCRNAVGYRENAKSVVVKHQNHAWEAFWQIAETMHQAGMIPEVDLFFYLKMNEAVQIIEGNRNPMFIWKAKQRKRLMPQMDRLRFDVFVKGFRMGPRVSIW